jgi:hypothetical protein
MSVENEVLEAPENITLEKARFFEDTGINGMEVLLSKSTPCSDAKIGGCVDVAELQEL